MARKQRPGEGAQRGGDAAAVAPESPGRVRREDEEHRDQGAEAPIEAVPGAVSPLYPDMHGFHQCDDLVALDAELWRRDHGAQGVAERVENQQITGDAKRIEEA